MTTTKWSIAAMCAVGALGGIAVAQQPVHVQLNGSPVATNAQEVNGRVLVPVRGVMEQLGASVDYIPATQIVNATKDGMNVQLRLGSKNAMVNGQTIVLDVPAQMIDGSTMVPLRFLSEAFGATVAWNAQSDLVTINTSNGAAQQIVPQTPPGVQIQSFDRRPPGTIGSGGGLIFTLTGTPGATATVQIPGATDEIPMNEVSPGQYQATVSFPPEHPITLMHATAIARLKTDSGTKVVVLSNPMDIDTAPPAITSIWPKDTLVPELRPSVNAMFNDGVGPGIDPASVTLIVDGQDVSHSLTQAGSYLTYTPNADLAPGNHSCELKITDRAGNVNDQKWIFTTAQATDLAKSIDAQIPANCQPGQQIAITMVGAPSSQATYCIGSQVTNQPMTEVRPGVYTANYTIQPGQYFYNDRIMGQIHTQDNQTFALTAPQTLLVMAGPPTAPAFSSSLADSIVGKDCTITGTGPANSRIHIWVDYRSNIGHDLSATGSLYDAIVMTDGNGNFSTGSIKVDPGLASTSDIKIAAHAETFGWDGKKSEATVVAFRRG
jgi:hypothetical protein